MMGRTVCFCHPPTSKGSTGLQVHQMIYHLVEIERIIAGASRLAYQQETPVPGHVLAPLGERLERVAGIEPA